MRLVVTAGRVLRRAAGLLTLLTLIALPAVAQEHANKANWALADQFSTANLRSRLYATSVNPHWLGQSDSPCYDWKDHSGSAFYMVVPTM